jgi:O-antigen ligase
MAEMSYATASAASRGDKAVALGKGFGPFALGTAAVLGLGAANGGYFPTSWGWPILAFTAIVLWAANGRVRARMTGAETTFVSGLLGLAIWFAISSLWGVSSSSLEQTFRVLVYATGAAAALSLVHRTSVHSLLGGTLTGTSAIALYALGTRLFPDRIGSFSSVAVYRLSAPLGYWNALGLLCVIGLLVSLALATSASSPARAAAAALPAPVLLLTLYFTFSRGSWISLGVGLVLAVALDPRRVRLTAATLALAIPSAIGVLLASHSKALTHEGATVVRAAHDGHRLALIVLFLAVASALLAAGANIAVNRVTLPATVAAAYAIVLAAAVLITLVVALVHFGGPTGAARRTWDSFSSPPPKTQPDLQKRLFSFSGNGRADLWRAAWHDFEAHPIIGSGAGSYEGYWLQHRTTPLQVKNAHSLYLETLAELGIVGFVLLIVALAAPLVAAFRVRRQPGIAVAMGAYVAYLVGAGVDWDWQLAAVTLAALFVGVALLAAARPDGQRTISPRLRYGVMAVAAAIGAAGFVFLVGNLFLSRSSTAAAKGNWTVAAHDAQRASDWLPWSTAPLDQLGKAQLGAGNVTAARASFHKAIAKDPGDWNLWFDLARASSGAAQTAALTRASKLDPLSPEVGAFKSELGAQGGIGITAK